MCVCLKPEECCEYWFSHIMQMGVCDTAGFLWNGAEVYYLMKHGLVLLVSYRKSDWIIELTNLMLANFILRETPN